MNWLRKARVLAKIYPEVKIETFVIDVDGVLTDGGFYYDDSGKRLKRFGPDDADALTLISNHLQIVFVSADSRGWEISRKRVEDMGFEVFLVPAAARFEWAKEKFNVKTLAYMGDSFQDAKLLGAAALGISPANGHRRARSASTLVTASPGGSRAVAEACGAIARYNRLPIRRIL